MAVELRDDIRAGELYVTPDGEIVGLDDVRALSAGIDQRLAHVRPLGKRRR